MSTFYYPLFEHMSKNHGLTLLDSELEDICRVVCTMKLAGLIERKSKQAGMGEFEFMMSALGGNKKDRAKAKSFDERIEKGKK